MSGQKGAGCSWNPKVGQQFAFCFSHSLKSMCMDWTLRLCRALKLPLSWFHPLAESGGGAKIVVLQVWTLSMVWKLVRKVNSLWDPDFISLGWLWWLFHNVYLYLNAVIHLKNKILFVCDTSINLEEEVEGRKTAFWFKNFQKAAINCMSSVI